MLVFYIANYSRPDLSSDESRLCLESVRISYCTRTWCVIWPLKVLSHGQEENSYPVFVIRISSASRLPRADLLHCVPCDQELISYVFAWFMINSWSVTLCFLWSGIDQLCLCVVHDQELICYTVFLVIRNWSSMFMPHDQELICYTVFLAIRNWSSPVTLRRAGERVSALKIIQSGTVAITFHCPPPPPPSPGSPLQCKSTSNGI